LRSEYEAPKTEVILLEEEDIILTSPGSEGVVDSDPEGAAMFF
jgi:hypothetical protein